MSPGRKVLAACLAAGLLASAAPAAWADKHDKLRHQRHHAAALEQRAHDQSARLQTSQHALARLDRRANSALAAFQTARLAAEGARAKSDAAAEQLETATATTSAATDRLYAMAADVYRSNATGGLVGTTLAMAENGDPQQFIDGVQLLDQMSRIQTDAVDDLAVAQAHEQHAAGTAELASDAATAAEDRAGAARQRADRLVARQQRLVARQHRLLAHTQDAAATAQQRVQALQHQIAAAAARARAIRLAQAQAVSNGTAFMAKCNGASVSGYPNGQLPTGALCPLWGAPGEMLRADAASGFNAMSRAYAAAFGTPLCVNASYRTYQRQVELYATMPSGYAAVPGTSNHGWGLAVDLCGGIQVDGSPQSRWLLEHAPAFHWFHPAWAMPGGGGPHEPWHWEYAG
jgi:hypothetical protein